MPLWAIFTVLGALYVGGLLVAAALLDVSGPDPLQREHEDEAQR